MNSADFHKLTEIRIKEAKVLLDRKCYEGAYYLAGYAVECALKACIAKKTQAHDFPPQDAKSFYTHDLVTLLSKADLNSLRQAREQKLVKFRFNWAVVKDWKTVTRYDHQIDAKRARDLYHAITNVRYGVLPWLKKYW